MREKIEAAIERGFDKDHSAETIADAVLAVLREPTPEMVEAGFGDDGYQCIYTAAISPEDRVGIWRAMIDAASSEGMVRVEEER